MEDMRKRIEKGMYIRTKITNDCNNVYIARITEVLVNLDYDYDDYKDIFCVDRDIHDKQGDMVVYLTPDDIQKASFNIIDLIESGDYVNGYLVDYVRKDENDKKWVYLDNTHTYNLCEKDIKSVVTHEQFEEIKYEVIK